MARLLITAQPAGRVVTLSAIRAVGHSLCPRRNVGIAAARDDARFWAMMPSRGVPTYPSSDRPLCGQRRSL